MCITAGIYQNVFIKHNSDSDAMTNLFVFFSLGSNKRTYVPFYKENDLYLHKYTKLKSPEQSFQA